MEPLLAGRTAGCFPEFCYVPLGFSVTDTLSKKQITLGAVCALLSNVLRTQVNNALGIFPDVTEPQEVDLHVWKYLFSMQAFCIEDASCERLFPDSAQYWLLSHGKQILLSMKIEFQCGDFRKYAGKRKTYRQTHCNLLGGRQCGTLQVTH